MIIIDYYSNFKAVDQRPDTRASTVILKLKGHFTKNEISHQAVSGIGPQFTLKEFAIFTKSCDFNNLSSSPGNSKANGKAESEVTTAKHFLRSLSWLGQINTSLSFIIGTPSDNYKSCTAANWQEEQNALTYYAKPPSARNNPAWH